MKTHPLPLALALLSLSACAMIQRAASLERPRLTYESWSAEQLDLEGVTIDLHYRIDNPNGFGLNLTRLGYRLEVEGKPLVEGLLPSGVQMQARGATPLSIPVRLRWRALPDFLGLLATRSDLGYRVSGLVGVGTPLGSVDLPFEHADRVPVPRLPSFRLEGVALRGLSTETLALDLQLRVENGNGFPLPVGALTYGLKVGERDLASGSSSPLSAVPARGHATVIVPVRIPVRGFAGAVSDLVGGAPFRLRGRAGVGGLEVPVDVPGRVR